MKSRNKLKGPRMERGPARLLLFSKSCGLIFFGQQERGYGAVRFRDNPQLVASLCAVGAQEPEPVLYAVVVFVPVLVGQIAPLCGIKPFLQAEVIVRFRLLQEAESHWRNIWVKSFRSVKSDGKDI